MSSRIVSISMYTVFTANMAQVFWPWHTYVFFRTKNKIKVTIARIESERAFSFAGFICWQLLLLCTSLIGSMLTEVCFFRDFCENWVVFYNTNINVVFNPTNIPVLPVFTSFTSNWICYISNSPYTLNYVILPNISANIFERALPEPATTEMILLHTLKLYLF